MSAHSRIRSLWSHPLIVAQLDGHPAGPQGHSVDDVLAALHALGQVTIRVLEDGCGDDGRPRPLYLIDVTRREQPQGCVSAVGATLTEASLRCLLSASGDVEEAARAAVERAEQFVHELERVDCSAGLAQLTRWLGRQ